MSTAADAAAWMKAFVDSEDYLDQHVAVAAIMERFGEKFAWINPNGNLAISPAVLKAFNAATGDAVVWERRGRMWRRRQDHDLPGRMQP